MAKWSRDGNKKPESTWYNQGMEEAFLFNDLPAMLLGPKNQMNEGVQKMSYWETFEGYLKALPHRVRDYNEGADPPVERYEKMNKPRLKIIANFVMRNPPQIRRFKKNPQARDAFGEKACAIYKGRVPFWDQIPAAYTVWCYELISPKIVEPDTVEEWLINHAN